MKTNYFLFFIFILNIFIFIQSKNNIENGFFQQKQNIEEIKNEIISLKQEIELLKIDFINKNISKKSDIYKHEYLSELKRQSEIAEENLSKNPIFKKSTDDLMNRMHFSNYEYGVNHNILKKKVNNNER